MIKRYFYSSLSFFLIAFVACAVSFTTLYTQSIRLDESQSIWDATKSIPALLISISEDVHVPLYHILLHYWMQFFGTDIFLARLLSLLFFLLTLPILFNVARDSTNEKVATLTVMLFSFSPFVIWYSNEARMYTLFTFITCLNHYYFLKMERTHGEKYQIAFIMTTIIGLYTHYFFNFLLFTQGLYVLSSYLFTPAQEVEIKKEKQRLFWRYVKQLFISYLFFLPWVAFVLMRGGAANTQPLIPAPTSYNIFQVFVNFIFGFQTNGIQAALVSLWPIAILVLFFLFTKHVKFPVLNLSYFVMVTIIPIMLVFLASYFRPIFLSRYLIFVTPTLFFLLAWIMLSYSQKISRILIIGFTGIMLSLLLYQNISLATPVKEDYHDVDTYLEQHATPKDIIAVSAPFTIYPIEYSYTGVTRIDTIPLWDRYVSGSIPPYSQENLQKQLTIYQKKYQNMYVVLSYDQGYEEKIKQYLDSHYQRLDLKKFSPGLELRVYKLRYN